jgi:hypothetical protein
MASASQPILRCADCTAAVQSHPTNQKTYGYQSDFKLFSTTNPLGSNSSLKSLNAIHCNAKYIETTLCTAKSRQV